MYQTVSAILSVNMPESVRVMPWHSAGLHCHTHYHS